MLAGCLVKLGRPAARATLLSDHYFARAPTSISWIITRIGAARLQSTDAPSKAEPTDCTDQATEGQASSAPKVRPHGTWADYIYRPATRIWKPEEDELLLQTVKIYGLYNWKAVSKVINKGGGPRQCHKRYIFLTRHQRPKHVFTTHHDEVLMRLVKDIDRDWSKFYYRHPHFTEREIRGRWSILRVPRQETWNPDELGRLRAALNTHGTESWRQVAMVVQTRTTKECYTRWFVSPVLQAKQPWSRTEDVNLIMAVFEFSRPIVQAVPLWYLLCERLFQARGRVSRSESESESKEEHEEEDEDVDPEPEDPNAEPPREVWHNVALQLPEPMRHHPQYCLQRWRTLCNCATTAATLDPVTLDQLEAVRQDREVVDTVAAEAAGAQLDDLNLTRVLRYLSDREEFENAIIQATEASARKSSPVPQLPKTEED
ncbi:hypothetical protein IWQ60_001471 [Tieghemiomyces parasiticus]|uniref:Myb-like domain-containing protein n=1 Tax=Tieghemiomyces parasiticus TaxID=78921 RepID=A0A9W8AH05_9FUNG|nr:hypothetical protein IWQ60_001471 [Tieghemiomyces parasiticus]